MESLGKKLTLFTAIFSLLSVIAIKGTANSGMDARAVSYPVVGQELSSLNIPVPATRPEMKGMKVERVWRKIVPEGNASAAAASYYGLSDHDIELYRAIFSLQDEARWDEADQKIADLVDPVLSGHVLYQRYMHPTGYVSDYNELKSWLEAYADHPNADKIYTLAQKKAGEATDANGLKKPQSGKTLRALMPSLQSYSRYDHALDVTSQSRQVISSVHSHLARDEAALALDLIDANVGNLTPRTVAILRSRVAAAYLYMGKNDKARALSVAILKSDDVRRVPLAGWVAGLISWRQEDYDAAATYFEQTALSSDSSAWTTSAGAYWAARAYTRVGNYQKARMWLKRAADYPYSFYGLIASYALGQQNSINYMDEPDVADNIEEAVSHNVARGIALAQIGRYDLSEKELRRLNESDQQVRGETLIAVAQKYQLPYFAIRLGGYFPSRNGKVHHAAYYPDLPWLESVRALQVDKALINAIIRQESKFIPTARSVTGATGLMQIMPQTARQVVDRDYSTDTLREKLQDPLFNLDVGQKYISHLLELDSVQNDLFSMAIAYNAGPGNLGKWKSTLKDVDDPLLFIEMIPMSETRAFVERVVTNFWVYRMRYNQPVPTLEAVAKGQWPIYASFDKSDMIQAQLTQR